MQRMLIVLTRSNVAQHVMLAKITPREPQDAPQQWLAHYAGNHLKTAQRFIVLPCSSRSSIIWLRSESIILSSDSRTRVSQRLIVQFTNVKVYNMSFFPRTIQDWNKLSPTKLRMPFRRLKPSRLPSISR